MTDIVERLREHAVGLATDLSYRVRVSDLDEAADEIDRLRDCNVELETRRNNACREIERMRAEKAKAEGYMDQFAAEANRLRDALEAAYEYIDHATGALPIIRAALGEGKNA